jgi:hypothetical protein
MIGVAVAGGLVDWLVGARGWMPNVCIGALSVAVTIRVVERAFINEEKRRDRPIVNVIRSRLELQVMGFVYSLLSDYSTTHLYTETPIPDTLVELCGQWLDGTQDSPRPARPAGAYPYLMNEAREVSRHLAAARAQYAFVLEKSPLLVDAIERFAEWVAQGSSFVEREKGGPALTPEYEHVLLARIVEATRNLAAVLKSEIDYEIRIAPEQRSAAEDWNRQGRALAAQRDGQPDPGDTNAQDDPKRDQASI